MTTRSNTLRFQLLATLTMTVALSGCVTDGMGTKKGSAAPVVAESMDDPMLAPPPDGAMDSNGSRRVPLGQLAGNAQPPAAQSKVQAPAGKGPTMLVPPPSPGGSTLDPMSAAPPSNATIVAAKPAVAPVAPSAVSPAAPTVLTAAPQPETLAKMGKGAPKAAAKVEPPKLEMAAVEPPKVESPKAEPPKIDPPKAVAPAPAPRLEAAVKPGPLVTNNLQQARAAAGLPLTQPEPQMKLAIPPKGSAPKSREMDPNDTVVISSTTTTTTTNSTPVHDTREFIPATLASAGAAPMLTPPTQDMPGAMASRPLSAAEKNVALRFENLKLLLDQGMITPEEYVRHRNANLGALLPYTHDPGAVGLERPVPSGDAIVARLEALRRSLEVRAISTRQHAMERTMIINALLPDAPTDRMGQMPPPEDVIQAATIISHLQTLRARNIVSAEEFNAEKNAIESYMRTGAFKPQPVVSASATAAKAVATKKAETSAKAEAMSKAEADELTAPVPGPVLHLASFRSQDAAKRAWQEALDRNKALLGQVKPVIRRIDLGPERGVFYRLMAGPYASLQAAEGACQSLKQNNQFCRASADGT